MFADTIYIKYFILVKTLEHWHILKIKVYMTSTLAHKLQLQNQNISKSQLNSSRINTVRNYLGIFI